MTDYKSLSDSELTEALNFHRRQRNMSRGINEAAHARQTQMVRMLEAEEARRLDEAVKVDKKNYSWGKMITVRHGSSHSFPLHPEHQEKIKNLKDGESTAFKDETGSHVTASRDGDKVHLKLRGVNQKTTVAHSHFTEEVEQIDENIAGKFKDSSEWEQAAKSRGLFVKSMTHPSGETTKYQIAKDKEGNNRGHFDHGTKSGHLKEEVELDENIAGKFKDSSEWEQAAKSRGLVVKSMTHPSGEATKYQIAKDKEGNNRGHFDHGTKSGHLKEAVELDEISTELKKRYVEKGTDDVVDRFTKIYNKWPKKATYAVHTPDRKSFKEFYSLEAAKAHHAEKSGDK